MKVRLSSGEHFARAAVSFVGTKFKLHGRRPEQGLDCIGLVHASLERIGRSPIAPQGYSLRNAEVEPWLDHASRSGFRTMSMPAQTGDLLLTSPGPSQHHLMIICDKNSVVHAHAGLRRVVIQPFDDWPTVLVGWRLI